MTNPKAGEEIGALVKTWLQAEDDLESAVRSVDTAQRRVVDATAARDQAFAAARNHPLIARLLEPSDKELS